MARQESDREDLLREATALVERVELAAVDATDAEHVVVGFRRDGALSAYFGDAMAYHFNSAGELRRAYVDGLLFKAGNGQLISLERVRTEREVQLLSRQLNGAAQAEFVATMLERLHELARQINGKQLMSVGQVPEGVDVLGRISRWLQHADKIRVAASPHAR